MEPDKKPSEEPTNESPNDEHVQQAPADALSRTPDDLEQEAAAKGENQKSDDTDEIKLSPAKRLFRKINVYLLIFVLILVVAGIITIVFYFNSTKAPTQTSIESQQLTQETLKQLANTDATVGDASQTLTIQGNAIIAGQTLMRGNLNVAGNFQSGGSIQGPSLTISGQSNLGETQINNLQVATNTAVQGTTTLRDLNVSGASSFSGAVSVSQLTVTNLILSGNASLRVPNHIAFTGPSPNRTNINNGVLGAGGTASIDGSDTTGTINVNTGGSPTAGCFLRVAFSQAFSNSPHVIVSPVGSGAGQLQYYVDRDKTGFSLCTVNAAPANQVFAFDYFVTN